MPKECGAKKRSGGFCRKPPLKGKTRCRLHGGASLAGIAHPGYSHGRYSKTLPTRLQERYQASLHDPELLSCRSEISVIDSRMSELFSQLEAGSSVGLWEDCFRLAKNLSSAIASGRRDEILQIATQIEDVARKGKQEEGIWREFHKMADLRRKLSESEVKRLEAAGHSISASEAMNLAQSLLQSVRRNVSDRKVLSAIATDFQILISKENKTLSLEENHATS